MLPSLVAPDEPIVDVEKVLVRGRGAVAVDDAAWGCFLRGVEMPAAESPPELNRVEVEVGSAADVRLVRGGGIEGGIKARF